MDNVVKAVPTAAAVPSSAEGQPPTEKKVDPRFLDPDLRELTIPLTWPVEYEDKIYTAITLKRPTISQWTAYNEAVQKAIEARGERAGDEIDQPFYDAPAPVMNNLDFIDGAKIEEALSDFFSLSPSNRTGAGKESRSASGSTSPTS